MKRMNQWFAAMVVAVAAVGGAQAASAASVADAISQVFEDPQTPIILEDDNYSQIFLDDPAVGAIVYGFVNIQSIRNGNRPNDPNATLLDPNAIRNISQSGDPDETVTIGGSSDFNELTGFFAARLGLTGNNPEPDDFPGSTVQYLTPLAPGTTFTTPDGDTIIFNPGGPVGTVLQLFEDPANNFDASDPDSAYDTTVSGEEGGNDASANYIGSIGFENIALAGPPATYEDTGLLDDNEYFVNYFFGVPGAALPTAFKMSLNFLEIPDDSPFAGRVRENDTNNTFYAEGFFTGSDPNFTVVGTGALGKVLVPTPAAFVPGVIMFGMLAAGFRGRTRRNTEETTA